MYNKHGFILISCFSISVVIGVMLFLSNVLLSFQNTSQVLAVTDSETGQRKVPVDISSENIIYVTWWTNNTVNGNDDVLFRASTDGGNTFKDKINLSNTSTSDSLDAMISADGEIVAVTWWERNNTTNEPVMRISNDAGQTFGSLLKLSQNGTIESIFKKTP